MMWKSITFSLAVSVGAIGGCGNDNDDHPDAALPADLSQVPVIDAGPVGTSASVKQTNLVSDEAGANHTDPMLINAWGLAFSPTGTAWVASNGAGTSQLYDGTGTPNAMLPSVTIPAPKGATGASAPTGLVFNSNTAAFKGDVFLFATEDGTIAGWQQADAKLAVLEVDNSSMTEPPVYKGLALATSNGVTRLFATDFHNGKIDIYDINFLPVTLAGAFSDPNLPAGFAPFGVQAIGTRIYVSYAKQDAARKDDVAGVGNGYVDTYDFNGANLMRLISAGALNSPWGMALAPANFGKASGSLIVGNFGDGHLNAYDNATGSLVTPIMDANNGLALFIDGVWSLVFGNGTTGEAQNQLFFTSGPAAETHGFFGRLDLVQ